MSGNFDDGRNRVRVWRENGGEVCREDGSDCEVNGVNDGEVV